MNHPKKIVAVVGSYRKGGIVDSAIDEILASATQYGATTSKIYLMDQKIEFCRNCRACTQEPGLARGKCPVQDDMLAILDQIEAADGLVLGSSMNFGTVTAIMKRFIERTVCYAYWPWESTGAPQLRHPTATKKAVLVASSAAPGLVARLATKLVSLLKKTARILGAKTTGVLFIGLVGQQPDQQLASSARKKAQRLGKKLAVG